MWPTTLCSDNDTDTHRSSVTAVAFPPQTLTVRPSASTRTDPEHTRYKFTLRAVFDNGAGGRLTENLGVTWSPAEHADEAFGLLIQPGDASGNTFTITATLPAALGGSSATATMQIGTPWQDDPDVPTVSIVVGGGWPGTTLPISSPTSCSSVTAIPQRMSGHSTSW